MRYLRVLGIKFIDGSFEEIISDLSDGGLMVVPAAPSLATIEVDFTYRNALLKSDIAIFDSGYLCLLLRFFKGIHVRKVSGLEFLRKFLKYLQTCQGENVLLVDPSHADAAANKNLLQAHGINLKIEQYVAPIYQADKLIDECLLQKVEELRPKYIIINLGGGVQEVLGAYLKKEIDEFYKPIIICTGAAIAFLTGRQANIPKFMDYLYLGWLSRCISDPKRFIPRYLSGFKLFKLIIKTKVEKIL